jgi:predicted 2-oxoglutarate/Fe(II)-dependent dioxygenase YbiX
MEKDLTKYLANYENFLDQDYCKKAVKALKKAEWSTHQFYQSGSGNYVSYENELSVSWSNIRQRKEIQDKLHSGLTRYLTELPDVAKAKVHKWFCGWEGYSELRFNKYDETTQMKLHCDHIHSMFDGQRKGIPTLSLLGCLNDDYEGGELIMWEDQEIELKGGSLLIFPSNFMYPHEVKPVTKGSRYSYVSWAW